MASAIPMSVEGGAMRREGQAPTWMVAAIFFGAALLMWWFVTQQHAPSAGEVEADVFARLERTGASAGELCAQAKAVERAFIQDGSTSQADHWTERRSMQCLNAAVCAQIVGGCHPGS